MRKTLLIAAAAALIAGSFSAIAGNTVLFSSKGGDVTFPFTPPTRAGAAGLIDNMTIGATTPRAITASTLKTADGLVCPTFYVMGAPAALTDVPFFVATRPYILVSASEVHAVAAGGASVVQITKDTGTNAPGAGTDLLTNTTNTGFNLNGTANTVQVGTLTATAADLALAAGDRLSLDFGQAVQSSAGIAITACLAPQ